MPSVEQVNQLKEEINRYLEQELKNYPSDLQPTPTEKNRMADILTLALLDKDNRPRLHKGDFQQQFQQVVLMEIVANKHFELNKELLQSPDFRARWERPLDQLTPQEIQDLKKDFMQSLQKIQKNSPQLKPFVEDLQKKL